MTLRLNSAAVKNKRKSVGQLEAAVHKRAAREQIQRKLTLWIARLTDRSGRSVLAPEALLVRRLGLREGYKRQPAHAVREALFRLEKKGLIKCGKTQNGRGARLTQHGKEFVHKMELMESLKMRRPKRWDGRWRIVIFDIWERRRKVRDKLRFLLMKVGFYKLQGSVWVYPYDSEELVALLRADMHLGNGILYLIAEGIENDTKLKRHFKLR
jgi:DNA-binding transcriptional regulator PaaX